MRSMSIMISIVLTLLMSVMSFAKTNDWSDQGKVKNVEISKRYVSTNEARITGIARGRLISSVEISLINLGNGVAEINANELCHEPMEKIKMVLYLEKWNETQEAWDMEERFQYEWKTGDDPEDDVSMEMVSFNVYGLERGYKYRVRGLFGAYALDSSLQEVWQAWTEDVYFD